MIYFGENIGLIQFHKINCIQEKLHEIQGFVKAYERNKIFTRKRKVWEINVDCSP